MIDLLRLRADVLVHARPSVAYCRARGLDWSPIEAACGGVFLVPVRPDRAWFDVDPDGVEAAVCQARGPDSVEVVDLVAWSLDNPARWWTAIGAAVVLGEAVAHNPATGFGGAPLRLFRHPLRWLQAGCDGAVILDPARGGRWLLDLPVAAVAAEDDAHAAELSAVRDATVDRVAIVVPAVASREPTA